MPHHASIGVTLEGPAGTGTCRQCTLSQCCRTQLLRKVGRGCGDHDDARVQVTTLVVKVAQMFGERGNFLEVTGLEGCCAPA
jgi:hypothetical protein